MNKLIALLYVSCIFIIVACSQKTNLSDRDEAISYALSADPDDMALDSSTLYKSDEYEEVEDLNVESSIDEHNNTTDIMYDSLEDRLRKIGSLTLTGYGDNLEVTIRGLSSATLAVGPIYIVDGINMGRSYRRVNSGLDPNQIKSIKVLKSLSQTSVYGEDGNNGVIIIKTLK